MHKYAEESYLYYGTHRMYLYAPTRHILFVASNCSSKLNLLLVWFCIPSLASSMHSFAIVGILNIGLMLWPVGGPCSVSSLLLRLRHATTTRLARMDPSAASALLLAD